MKIAAILPALLLAPAASAGDWQGAARGTLFADQIRLRDGAGPLTEATAETAVISARGETRRDHTTVTVRGHGGAGYFRDGAGFRHNPDLTFAALEATLDRQTSPDQGAGLRILAEQGRTAGGVIQPFRNLTPGDYGPVDFHLVRLEGLLRSAPRPTMTSAHRLRLQTSRRTNTVREALITSTVRVRRDERHSWLLDGELWWQGRGDPGPDFRMAGAVVGGEGHPAPGTRWRWSAGGMIYGLDRQESAMTGSLALEADRPRFGLLVRLRRHITRRTGRDLLYLANEAQLNGRWRVALRHTIGLSGLMQKQEPDSLPGFAGFRVDDGWIRYRYQPGPPDPRYGESSLELWAGAQWEHYRDRFTATRMLRLQVGMAIAL